MEISGNIRKMQSELKEPVEYTLVLGGTEVKMNELLGSQISIEYLGEIHCVKCGRLTRKSFAQGYCYPCFTTAPETEECVLRPELCRAHEGVARDMEYAQKNCLIEQVVYLSITSGVKVGVTRNTQVPFRWIDQGAVQAIELARTPNRYTAGLIEVHLKSSLDDKTNWRAMLKNEILAQDLIERKYAAIGTLPENLAVYASSNDHITNIVYPVKSYPEKVGSMNLEKEPRIEGILEGIKGQYLIFRGNKVINIRNFGGYKVKLSY